MAREHGVVGGAQRQRHGMAPVVELQGMLCHDIPYEQPLPSRPLLHRYMHTWLVAASYGKPLNLADLGLRSALIKF
jgi:hypothetical protein